MPNEHTDKKYEEELRKLREDILYMGGLVEDQILKAVQALVVRDSGLADIIIERDHEVNRLDVDIDDVCIRLLALHQPAGRDLLRQSHAQHQRLQPGARCRNAGARMDKTCRQPVEVLRGGAQAVAHQARQTLLGPTIVFQPFILIG